MAMKYDSKFYEKGFTAKAAVPEMEPLMGGEKPGYLEGHNSSPSFKKYDYEADGAGSTGPAAR